MMLSLLLASSIEEDFKPGEVTSFTLKKGHHILHVFGAQGGSSYNSGNLMKKGGRGTYVKVGIHLYEDTEFEGIVGTQGSSSPQGGNKGGYPNGGRSGIDKGAVGNDGSGGGGGSSSILNNGKILVVAGAGSGAADYMEGCQGGINRKVYCAVEGDICVEKDEKAFGYETGFGGNGTDSIYVPGSGGGGGFYGGKENQWSDRNAHFAVACSGSSVVDYRLSSWGNLEGEADIQSNITEGNGSIQIETVYLCKEECGDCRSSSSCTRCNGKYSFYEGQCLEVCPPGYLGLYNQCKQCKNNCAECSGNLNTCTACSGDLNLYGNECIQNCPEGFVAVNNVCQKCSDNCLECSDSPNKCTKCSAGLLLDEGICKDACGKGKFMKDGHCESCDSSCSECYSDYNFCISCKDEEKLYDGKCLQKCPNGTFESENGNQCIKCSDNCQTCAETSDNCKSCNPGTYLFDNECKEHCPIGWYSTMNNICMECSNNCKECSINSTMCISCNNGFILQNGNCVIERTPLNTPFRTKEPKIEIITSAETNNYAKESNHGISSNPDKKNNSNIVLISSIAVGIVAFIAIICIIIIVIIRHNKKQEETNESSEIEFSEDEILKITETNDYNTMTNPIWTTDILDDTDIFREDFEEQSYAFGYSLN